MTVKARFVVQAKKEHNGGYGEVMLNPVTSDDKHSGDFWRYTPSGEIRLGIDNPAAFNALELGETYEITFERVVDDAQSR